jgi:hypothetical protein
MHRASIENNSAKLFYDHISGTLITVEFEANPYDRCAFDQIFNGKQCTVTIHVDDLMISCVDVRVIHNVISQLEKVYTKVNGVVDQRVEYLGMAFDFATKGVAKIGMGKMVQNIVQRYFKTGETSFTQQWLSCFMLRNEVDPTYFSR